MKTDRELLELAAKAAGLAWKWNSCSSCGIQYIPEGLHHYVDWNPLTDDGDALRLAVKLGIDLAFYLDSCAVEARTFGQLDDAVETFDAGAGQAQATRRAIVRAAAAIGEQMQ